jgi:DNA repair ATPase RecN
MPFRTTLFQKLDKLEPDLKAVMFELITEIEQNQEKSVTRRDFSEFTARTEANFQRVWTTIGELAEAQKRTEQRLEELAEAQKRSEQRIEELAEAQKRTEQRLNTLVETVQQLTQTVQQLTQRVDAISVQLGDVSNAVGYGLEDQSYPRLKRIIQRDFNVEVDRLFRKNIVYARHRFDEINIYGEGLREGKKVYIIGECKSQFGANDVARYTAMLARVRQHLGRRRYR